MKKIRYLYRTLSVLSLLIGPVAMFLLGYFTASLASSGFLLMLPVGTFFICAILTLIVFWITRE